MSAIRAISVFSSQGRRPAQEDCVLNVQDKGIFVVADGFGGPVPGAAAAKTACEAVRSFLIKEAGDLEATLPFVLRSYFSLAGNVLFNALIHANRKVTQINKGKGVHERGGASVLAGFVDGDLLALANVGTCGAWLLRNGDSTELVTPRSYARLCDPFAKNPREDHRVPLMSVGVSEDVEPEIAEYRLKPNDWVLLQTDGISASVVEELCLIQTRRLAPGAASEVVLALLNQSSYDDNSTLSLVIF